jgi:hypothetical protein
MNKWKCPFCQSSKAPDFLLEQQRKVETRLEEGAIIVDREDLAFASVSEVSYLVCFNCKRTFSTRDFEVSVI